MSNSHINDVSINKDYSLECTNSSSDTNKHHYSYYGEQFKNRIYTINGSKIETMFKIFTRMKYFDHGVSFSQNFTHL